MYERNDEIQKKLPENIQIAAGTVVLLLRELRMANGLTPDDTAPMNHNAIYYATKLSEGVKVSELMVEQDTAYATT